MPRLKLTAAGLAMLLLAGCANTTTDNPPGLADAGSVQPCMDDRDLLPDTPFAQACWVAWVDPVQIIPETTIDDMQEGGEETDLGHDPALVTMAKRGQAGIRVQLLLAPGAELRTAGKGTFRVYFGDGDATLDEGIIHYRDFHRDLPAIHTWEQQWTLTQDRARPGEPLELLIVVPEAYIRQDVTRLEIVGGFLDENPS